MWVHMWVQNAPYVGTWRNKAIRCGYKIRGACVIGHIYFIYCRPLFLKNLPLQSHLWYNQSDSKIQILLRNTFKFTPYPLWEDIQNRFSRLQEDKI